MDSQRPAEAPRRKIATYGKLSSRGPRAHATSAPQTPSNREVTPSTTLRQKLPGPPPPRFGDPSRSQKALHSAPVSDQETTRKQRDREAETPRKRSHRSAFGMESTKGTVDISPTRRALKSPLSRKLTLGLNGTDAKDSKPSSFETGFINSHETVPQAVTPKKSTAVGTSTAKLGKEAEANASPTNKVPDTPPTRRRRLIDALVAEENVASSSSSSSSSSPSRSQSQITEGSDHVNNKEHKHAWIDRPSFRKEVPLRRTGSDSSALERRKVKFTYSQSRSFIQASQESDAAESTDYPSLLDEIDAPIKPPPSPVMDDDDDDELKNKVAIRSVHELRRAGANNRSSDEVDDLLSRIGTPGPLASSMRRNGLCELASRLQKKEFMNQFRDHASRDNIAKGISHEKDTISGFLLAAIFVIFLSAETAPHLLRQLTENRVGLWLNSLLAIQEDATAIAAQKSTNMSRVGRTALDSVKRALLEMDVWHGYKLQRLSPRTISLQLLFMLVGLLDPQDVRVLLDDTFANFSQLRSSFTEDDSREDVDYALTVLIMEAESNATAPADEPLMKIRQEMSDIAAFLQNMLQHWPRTRHNIDATLLKLAINTTNNETRAAALQNGRLLSSLVGTITSGFSAVQSAIQKSAFESNVYDELSLILGIMINVLEHCSDARTSIHEDEVEKLHVTWSESERSIETDDSVETSKLGIAYSYLAIILGYLYLGHTGLAVPGGLVPAIQHFITINKAVGDKAAGLEHLVYSLTRLR
ncbi:wings apart-like protein regulation of heterochromatin domain-containing protein [Trichoderma breve]|uniref:Wings apart-like protein regulation of heterochromatin domain-containing protein n=1 Tax=Trichoderma breve TaxID=2034170 RepID=A0A9W9E387_9HYPO|nr:wings apart-like protein regulation of heterochromatin domain-containing protein [Trichoderma breve]KAJ4856384.1 wings apart-like protein regulation of heterochromatin domain-containing protein [Trichoderma breve]